jgi:uncharacterized protein YkwD
MRGGLARIAAASVLAVTLLATAATAAPAASASLRRDKMLGWVNHARVEHGAHKLKMDNDVVNVAHDHNVDMATKDELFHSTNLGYKLRSVSWSTWGENVGAGVDAYGLFKAYMASPDHRANILNKNFDHVGINFVVRDGIMWSTLIFYG